MSVYKNIAGTTENKFQVGIGGPQVKNSSGTVEARNAADAAYAAVAASLFKTYGNDFELNSGAAGAGADWKMVLRRPSTGQTENLTVVFPAGSPSPAQALVVDTFTAGVITLQWQTMAAGNDKPVVDTTSIAFGSTSPVAMFTLPANAVVLSVRVIIDTAFDGTPSLSVGIAGTLSKYLPSTAVDLKAVATTVFEFEPGLPATGSSESLIATYAAGGAAAGAGRILVTYVIPS